MFGPASPVIGGIAALGASAAGVREAKEKKEFLKSAKRIDTSYADPLSNLLFVGQEAKDVTEGAEGIKSEAVAQGKAINDAADIQALLDVGSSLVLAGQSGTFDLIKGVEGTQSFLNKPLGSSTKLSPDASSLEKLQFAFNPVSNQSIGSLLGGVSPYQQSVGEGASEKISNFLQNRNGTVNVGSDFGMSPMNKLGGDAYSFTQLNYVPSEFPETGSPEPLAYWFFVLTPFSMRR